MVLRHPLRGELVVHDARNRDHRTCERKDVCRRFPYAMVGAYEYDWRIGRIEKKFYGVWMGSREVKMLTEVFLCDDARDEKRLCNMPGEMAERLLRDSPCLLLVRRNAALHDILYGNSATLWHERPHAGRKTGPDVVCMPMDKIHYMYYIKLCRAPARHQVTVRAGLANRRALRTSNPTTRRTSTRDPTRPRPHRRDAAPR